MNLYESFAQATQLGDLHTCLMMDMKACQEDDVRLLCYLTPSIYTEVRAWPAPFGCLGLGSLPGSTGPTGPSPGPWDVPQPPPQLPFRYCQSENMLGPKSKALCSAKLAVQGSERAVLTSCCVPGARESSKGGGLQGSPWVNEHLVASIWRQPACLLGPTWCPIAEHAPRGGGTAPAHGCTIGLRD